MGDHHRRYNKKEKHLDSDFLADFNPETSTRERRKLNRKNYSDNSTIRNKQQNTKNRIYDYLGRSSKTGADLCDCLEEECPGCHFPCKQCKSPKCGPHCRVHRRWAYELVEFDGKDRVVKNKNVDLIN